MNDFGLAHVGTAREGKPALIGDVFYQTYDRPRGTVAVEERDGTAFYRVSRRHRAAFRAWARDAFSGGMNDNRLVGAWPRYAVEVRS